MSVTLRLARTGNRNRPNYRIVAIEKARPRDGRFLEIIGNYNPLSKPVEINIKEDRVRHWISHGAETSKLVADLINKKIPGFLTELEKKRVERKQAARKKRKARLASASGGASKKESSKAKSSSKAKKSA